MKRGQRWLRCSGNVLGADSTHKVQSGGQVAMAVKVTRVWEAAETAWETEEVRA
jgi:hypothetical protein